MRRYYALLTLCIIISTASHAQMYNSGLHSLLRMPRSYFGAILPFNTLKVETNYREDNLPYDSMGTIIEHPWGGAVENNISYTAKSKKSVGVIFGTFYPLMDIGVDGKLAIAVEENTIFYKWETDTIRYSEHAQRKENMAGIHTGIYTSLDLKFGADAMLDRTRHLMYGFGVGMAPAFNAMQFGDNGEQFKFGITPFIRAEVGVCYWAALKVRATYQFASMFNMKSTQENWFNDPGAAARGYIPNDYSQSQIKSGNNFNLSLILYFSSAFRWNDDGYFY